MRSRPFWYVVLVICCALIRDASAKGPDLPTKIDIPKKIDQDQALDLVLAAEGHDINPAEWEFDGDTGAPFLVFLWWPPDPVQGVNAYDAVNPWTGDVWDFITCERMKSTPALRKLQREIRRRFTPAEMKQYQRLHRLKPQCIG
jgi:hypothetical protein